MNRHQYLLLVSIAALCLLSASPSFAQQKNMPSAGQVSQLHAQLSERFSKADLNKDGKLTKGEAEGKMPRVYEYFDRIDVDKKGYLTRQQIEDFGMKMLAERR